MVLALGSGCSKVTSENVQLWKTTQKGPERLKDAVGDRSVPVALRAEAAAALVDIGHAEEVETVIGGLPTDDRFEVIRAAIPIDEAVMNDPSPEKALAARDALFSLRQFAAADEKERIDHILLPALEKDLKSGRLRNGRHSIDKMLTAIGPAGASMLASVLAQPTPAYPLAADLLGRVGDDGARNKGATALVARARKEKPIQQAMWKAIGTLGGPAALAFLAEKSQDPNREDAVSAVRAMRERRDPAVLPLALKLAGDPKADKLVRDEMFGTIENIGGIEAQKGLLAIISSDKEEMVRYRAFEVALGIGKADGIIPALEAFPVGPAYKKIDVDDLLVKLIEKLGPAARPSLVKALDSRSPLTRMTAVMSLEQIGRASDAPALVKVSKDSTALKGFPAGETIGKAASRAAEVVKKKA
ncbi:MAG: hypothetical protein QOI66_2369 [Myxococcales bacterium]|nr:hypothetical protein [Myxococcales bacterium]